MENLDRALRNEKVRNFLNMVPKPFFCVFSNMLSEIKKSSSMWYLKPIFLVNIIFFDKF